MRIPGTMLALVALNCSFTVSALAQNRPNLIFILTDDQGIESIEGPYWPNDMECETPTLRELARQGVSFTNCRVNPNCSPTRAALMTGRNACDTGVNGVLGRFTPWDADPCTGDPLEGEGAKVTNRLGLQTQEKTIAEVLRHLEQDGYYTILVDKWHLGYNEDDDDLGLLPTQQGFHVSYDWMATICDDDPLQVGDEHMVDAYQWAVNAVNNRPWVGEEQMPYALFFHTITPHRRHGDEDPNYPLTEGFHWWRVHKDLCPETWALWGYDPGHPNQNNNRGEQRRFIQNVEAIDTVIRALLFDLGVIQDDENRTYRSQSKSIVFFLGDNGTDHLVSTHGEGRAKNSTFEGGLRVPLFVMGEGITDRELENTENTRLINHVDSYDTIGDIVGASPSERDNEYGRFPRRGISFAHAIGYGSPVDPRAFSLSSYGNREGGSHIWRVAFVWDHYKLVCNSDSNTGEYNTPGLDDMLDDEFYDFSVHGEDENLVHGYMTVEQMSAYLFMRDRLVDEWPTAVSVALPAEPNVFTVDHFITYQGGQTYVLVAYIENEDGEMTYVSDEFFDLTADPDREYDLLAGQMTQLETQTYNQLVAEMEEMVLDGDAAPDLRVVDVPCSSYLIMRSDSSEVTAELTPGHENVEDYGGDEFEYRARLKFEFPVTFELPPGFEWSDLIDAQIIVAFKRDSVAWKQEGYYDNDTDTGLITIHRMTTWTSELFNANNYETGELGSVDLPPHIIPDPPNPIRAVPMKYGNPVSFGHSEALGTLAADWASQSIPNYGVLFKAERLGTGSNPLPGDQHVHFLKQAVLRLTFGRDP